MMTSLSSLSSLGHDERSARIDLSLVAGSSDPSTGRLVGQVGAVELLRLADTDGAVPGLYQIAAAVWRERLHTVSSADTVATQMAAFERQGLRVVIPGEKDGQSLSTISEHAHDMHFGRLARLRCWPSVSPTASR